jgi:ATP-dependent DNA helicase RecG
MTEPVVIRERARIAIELGESHFREFKSAVEGPPGQKANRTLKSIRTDVAETLVAFANADGGELLVGVEDNGEISGLQTFDSRELEAIEKASTERIHGDTPLRSVRLARLEIDKRTILYFSVPKSHEFVHLTSDGKCMQRRDLETIPISSEKIHFDRREIASREYHRGFVEGPQADALDLDLVRVVAEHISPGMSPEKCLQYLDLAEYSEGGLLLRRAALLLFAKDPTRWHPRLQIRIMRVDGTTIGTGRDYNVVADQPITGNVLTLIERGWDGLRPHLVQTRLGKEARFHATFMYPEYACREALVNSIAHRDYSQEGRGIEIYVFQDRMEVTNPGSLLSTIKLEDLLRLEGVHQSRNSYVSRVLREMGYMRELGEGVRRIFDLMKSNELSPPELSSGTESFTITLNHRAIYSQEESLWLDQFSDLGLSREQKAIVVLGRAGRVITPQDIWDTLGLVDTEHYRRLVASLQEFGVLKSTVDRRTAQKAARTKRIPVKQIPRFRVEPTNSSTTKTRRVDVDVTLTSTSKEITSREGKSGSGRRSGGPRTSHRQPRQGD